MRNTVRIELLPLGRRLTVAPGTSLQDALSRKGSSSRAAVAAGAKAAVSECSKGICR